MSARKFNKAARILHVLRRFIHLAKERTEFKSCAKGAKNAEILPGANDKNQ